MRLILKIGIEWITRQHQGMRDTALGTGHWDTGTLGHHTTICSLNERQKHDLQAMINITDPPKHARKVENIHFLFQSFFLAMNPLMSSYYHLSKNSFDSNPKRKNRRTCNEKQNEVGFQTTPLFLTTKANEFVTFQWKRVTKPITKPKRARQTARSYSTRP